MINTCMEKRSSAHFQEEKRMPRKNDTKNDTLNTLFPYLLPYLAFIGVRAIADLFPYGLYLGYISAYAAASLFLWRYRREYCEMQGGRIRFPDFLCALCVGLLGIAIWILPYHYLGSFAKTDGFFGLMGGQRSAVNPHLLPNEWFLPFILLRSVGYIIVTPIFEELFIRSFLWRYLIDHDVRAVAIGKYTTFAFWGTAIAFSLSHNEWIVALLYACLINLLLITRKDIRLCIVAHGFSNAILIGYVWVTGKWFLW